MIRIHSSPETKKHEMELCLNFLFYGINRQKNNGLFFWGGKPSKFPSTKNGPWLQRLSRDRWGHAWPVRWIGEMGAFAAASRRRQKEEKKSFPDLVQLLGFHPRIFLAMKFRPLWKRKSPRSLGDENVMTMVVKALHRCDDPSSELAAGIFFSPVCCQGPLRFYADSQDSPWTLGRFAAGCGCV